jgi:serine/threonine protein kinase
MATPKPQPATVLELVEQFLARYRRGERPSLKEYIDQHPELAAEIREIFPARALMENITLADESIAEEPRVPPGAKLDARLRRLGDFRIIRKVGQGGMGVVYEAEQVSLGRHVALKILPQRALHDATLMRRFAIEARAAAKLHHTNIVPVFGFGEHDGMPYYVMQFIQGLGLDAVLEELRRAQTVAEPTAMYVDARLAASDESPPGIDADPSMLTVRIQGSEKQSAGAIETPVPAATLSSASIVLPGQSHDTKKPGRPKQNYWQSVARIGVQVADALEYAHRQGILHRDVKPSNLLLDRQGTVWVTDFGVARADDQPHLTQAGEVLGTLRYMPPEAFEGRNDPRSDVYSLGLTLYELLALRPAFPEKDRDKLIKQLSSQDPVRLRKLNPAVPRDLETIIQKATDREPRRRYPTAAELAADLERFLDDEPIKARRISLAEQFARWARRNRGLAASLAAIGGLLVVAALASTVGVLLLGAANERERNARGEAERQRDEARLNLYVANMNLAQREWESGNITHVHALLAEYLPSSSEPDLRGWEWYFQDRLCHSDLRTLRGHAGPVHGLACSPDGSRVASAAEDGTVRIWELADGRCVHVLQGHEGWAASVTYRPDGRQIASAGPDGTVRLWDPETGQALHVWKHYGKEIASVTYSPDGRQLAVGGSGGELQLWDAASGKALCVLKESASNIIQVSFSPDGKWLASAQEDGDVQLWDLAHRKRARTLPGHGPRATFVVFSPDSTRLAAADDEGLVRVWETASGREEHAPSRLEGGCSVSPIVRMGRGWRWVASMGRCGSGPL